MIQCPVAFGFQRVAKLLAREFAPGIIRGCWFLLTGCQSSSGVEQRTHKPIVYINETL
jgi:hypothetical protein